jgi:hypothetical protein
LPHFLRVFRRRGDFFHTEKFLYPITIIDGFVAIGCKVFTYEECMGGKLLEVGRSECIDESEIIAFKPKLEKMYVNFVKRLDSKILCKKNT